MSIIIGPKELVLPQMPIGSLLSGQGDGRAYRVAWRRIRNNGPAIGSHDHLSVDGKRTLCNRSIPTAGELFEEGAGKFSGEQCQECLRRSWWVMLEDDRATLEEVLSKLSGPFASNGAALTAAEREAQNPICDLKRAPGGSVILEDSSGQRVSINRLG
jgi:hypothetical protein